MDYTSFAPGASAKPPIPPKMEPALPQPHKRHLPKFTGLIILLILIGGTAYGSMWWWNQIQNLNQAEEPISTSSPVADVSTWKTYTNTQYGFEFKYPSDWRIEGASELDGSATSVPIFTGVELRKIVQGQDYLGIDFTSSEENLLGNSSLSNSPSVDVNIGGVVWKAIKFQDCVPGNCSSHDSLSLTTKNKNRYYQIMLYPNDSTDINPVYLPILSTFKFSQTIEPMGGKIQGTVSGIPAEATFNTYGIETEFVGKKSFLEVQIDRNNHYSVDLLPGTYNVSVKKVLDRLVTKQVSITAGQNIILDFDISAIR